MWNPSQFDCECNKESFNIDTYLDIKNCSGEKRLSGELVIACEDEILNVTEMTAKDLTDNYNCFIHTISVVVIYGYYKLSFLLVVITIIQNIG